ncbi:enhanced adult sensory threshold isoform X2 [Rhynchophorus ferrugineus]|uniref:enhanced adult sensory threshold isoform X2 n=1 Tax=Rhynchophorus ferrugineus TaxID=354439 RepID=UPI003FCC2F85
MATRVKKPSMAPKEVVSSQDNNADTKTALTTKSQNGPGISKKIGKKPGPKKILPKTVPMKATKKTRKTALKINPKNLARVLIENGKGLEAKKILLKSSLKEVKPVRKSKAIKKLKQESTPAVEPSGEENEEVAKTPKKRGKKPKIPPLIALKTIKPEIKEEPIDDEMPNEEELPLVSEISAKVPGRKPGRQKKVKPDTSMEDVINDLTFLIKAEDIKQEVSDSTAPDKSDRSKKLTKKLRLEMLKRDLVKKQNIENTLSKLDPADTKIIDRLDLNVQRIKSKGVEKRRHSIEKFSVTAVDTNTEALLPQLSVFTNLPRCISPRTSKKTKLGMKRSSPYATRSDSPARILRNGKHRKLRDHTLLDGLEDVKRRKRVHSDLSGSETASKLSGYDSDSSISDLASLHGSEKDSELPRTNNKDANNLLIEETSNQSSKTPIESSANDVEKPLLMDTNSNVCGDLNEPVAVKLNEELVQEDSPMADTPSAKVPEKGFILDSMKQVFNEVVNKNQTQEEKCSVNEVDTDKSTDETSNETRDQDEIVQNELPSAQEALEKILEETPDDNPQTESSVSMPEDFCSEDKDAEEQESFENIVQGCIDSIGNISPELPHLASEVDPPPKQSNLEQDDDNFRDETLPVIDNMMIDTSCQSNSDGLDNLDPPQLESNVVEQSTTKSQIMSSDNDRKLGIAITEKDNVVSFSIEHIDDIEEHDQSNETIHDCSEEVNNKLEDEESEKVPEPMITNESEEAVTEQKEIEKEPAVPIEGIAEEADISNDAESVSKSKDSVQQDVEMEKQEENKTNETECDNKAVDNCDARNLDKDTTNESPEELAEKENILNALGLQSLRAANEAKHQKIKDKEKPSTSTGRGDIYTGTLKTVIKINKKKGKNSFKMTLQKNKTKADGEANSGEEGYKIMKEGASNAWKHNKDSSDTAGAHRKSHYSNRSNMDGSSEHTSDSEQAAHEKIEQQKSLVIPEKASSFSIHPERLCKDECSYCFGKFGLFDTPCHIAQMKSVERQNKILASEKHLTRDSCLCDACYRHVDRKSNSPSYTNKSLKRNSLVAPGPKQNHCHVLGCNNVSTNILRRKWIIKMRKSICQAINIDLDNPGLHSIPICDEHFAALEHLMVCAMCKRRLARNHIHYLGPEVKDLNVALKDEGICICLTDKPVVCKLCKCFASIILKDPDERAENSVNFFMEYKKRLLHFNDIVPMDAAAADEPIVVPTKNEKSSDKKDCEKESGKRKKRLRNSSNETTHSGKDSQEDKDDKNMDDGDEGTSDRAESKNPSDNHSDSQSPDEGDEYSNIDYNTLIPAIAMECPSDNESKKELSRKATALQNKISKIESIGTAVEISKTVKSKSDMNKFNDLAAQKLGKNPSISLRPNYSSSDNDPELWSKTPTNLISNPAITVRQLFQGEEDLGLSGNIDFNNVVDRTPEGWEKCVATIQYDEETKLLWQELQKPYGSKSSFLRHLILLEKYFRNGDLILSPTASHHATNYSESVHNRLRAYDNIPSSAGNIQPISMLPFNKMNKSVSIIATVGQSSSNNIPPVTISQIGKNGEKTTKTPITLHQLSQPPLLATNISTQASSSKTKTGAPPGLISLQTSSTKTATLFRNQPQSQKIKFPITKNWRPNLIPIDATKKNEKKSGLVQVISGGKPYHITLEDYKKMCAIKRSFEAKQKKLQEQQLSKQSPQSILLAPNSLLKIPKKGQAVNKTSGGIVTENKSVNVLANISASMSDSSETILEKLDKQVESLGQGQDGKSITIEKKGSLQNMPKIPKSLTVIPQTVRKCSRPPSPVLYITKNGVSNVNATNCPSTKP